jgi:hypothetical protein
VAWRTPLEFLFSPKSTPFQSCLFDSDQNILRVLKKIRFYYMTPN